MRRGPGSILAGPVEVFGQSASSSFANPSGITVNGAAFINSAHVILTTGAPLWLSAGSLTSDFAAASGFAFYVRSGRVAVGPLGVSTSNRLDLIGETFVIVGPPSIPWSGSRKRASSVGRLRITPWHGTGWLRRIQSP